MDWERRDLGFGLTCLKPREDMADDESLGWGTERGREWGRRKRALWTRVEEVGQGEARTRLQTLNVRLCI